MNDTLGDKLKALEQVEAGRKAMKGLPLLARLDGRSFHTWTRGFARPFDADLSAVMIETTKYLVQKTDALVGYTQSDEISLCWYVPADGVSEYMFDGKFQKLTSVLASLATGSFNNWADQRGMLDGRGLATFDCRVWQVPDLRTAYLNFLWRELDATKNAISMAASARFSPKQLHGKTSEQRLEMLRAEGIDFDAYPTFFKRGTYVRRVPVWKELTADELAKIPRAHWPTGQVLRTEVLELSLPPLRTLENPEEVLFQRKPPIVKG